MGTTPSPSHRSGAATFSIMEIVKTSRELAKKFTDKFSSSLRQGTFSSVFFGSLTQPTPSLRRQVADDILLWWATTLTSRGGNVNQNTNLFANAGDNGRYWSSTPNSNGTQAYNLNFNGTSNINPSNNNNRQYGYSIRCPCSARSPTFSQ